MLSASSYRNKSATTISNKDRYTIRNSKNTMLYDALLIKWYSTTLLIFGASQLHFFLKEIYCYTYCCIFRIKLNNTIKFVLTNAFDGSNIFQYSTILKIYSSDENLIDGMNANLLNCNILKIYIILLTKNQRDVIFQIQYFQTFILVIFIPIYSLLCMQLGLINTLWLLALLLKLAMAL